MTSTDSSQMNFNPSWMQPTSKGEKPNGLVLPPEDESAHEVMDPVFANYRYGREDILALLTKDVKPPDGLSECPFFVDKPQTPIILLPLNEIELRLQQNINSSKALSVLSRQDRNFLNGNDSSANNMNSKWTVAGGNRNYNSSNKPISNRWSVYGSGNNSGGNDGNGSFRSSRGGGAPLFSRTAPGVRPLCTEHPQSSPPKTVGARFRQLSTQNDTGFPDVNTFGNNNSSSDNTPIPSTSTGPGHNPWTKVGIVNSKPAAFGADTQSRALKSSDNAKTLLDDLAPRAPAPPPVRQEATNKTLPAFEPKMGIRQSYQPPKPGEVGEHLPSLPSQFQPSQPPPIQRTTVAAAVAKQPSPPKPDTKWNYLDPSGVERGPFDSRQMQAWFENGFFDGSLVLSKAGTKNYITLAELFEINGVVTPFISKTASPPPMSNLNSNTNAMRVLDAGSKAQSNPPSQTPLHSQINTVMADHAAASIWSSLPPPTSNMTHIQNDLPSFLVGNEELTKSMFNAPREPANIDKIIQEKLAEEQRKLREKQEQLLREERERAEKEQQILQREMELQRKQEELQRIAREKEEELEKKRQQVAEFERQRREALEKMEEKLRNEKMKREEEILRLETEAEERRRRELEEANIRAAYEEARRLREIAHRAEEEQRKALLAEQEARKKKEREDRERQAALEAKKKREQEEKAVAEKRQREEEEERIKRQQLEEELSKAAIQELLNAEQAPLKPKAAPWVTVGGGKASGNKKEKSAKPEENRGKSLLEIQREEEIAHRENLKRQQEELRRNAQATTQQPPGPWAKAEKNLGWGTPAFAPPKQGSSKMWNNVAAPLPAEIPKPQPKEQNKKMPQKKQQQPAKKPDLFNDKTKAPDAFTCWIVKRVRELNSSVDAEVFASFIEGVDSPDEAEDYIIGYLGDSKAAKEFHREFLNKRIELRPRVLPSAKDDLSRPAVAANDVFNSASSGSGANSSGGNANMNNASKKKKKGKAQKIDPTVLGFRAAGDPNRFNAGEIDTTLPAPTNRRR